MARKRKSITIPRRYVKIVKEKKKPTRYIMHRASGEMIGRLEKGDTLKKMASPERRELKWRGRNIKPSQAKTGRKAGRTRAIRMKKNWSPRGYKGKKPLFEEGENIGRTKKNPGNKPNFKKQPNTVLVRAHTRKKGKLGDIKEIRVKRHTRSPPS